MAEVPDPRSFTSWEDAFQYPLPVVRKLEQQLRKTTDENRQKLRSLVGTSYRNLLGTAERIIEMDEQMQRTETHLSDIGRKCNARAVERAGENYSRMKSMSGGGAEREKHRTLAQAKVLQSALTAAGRAMKSGGDALLVAKLLVLARLLHKGLSESAKSLAVLEDFRKKLGTLRKRLLSYTERMLIRSGTERSTLANTLCAYALITNSAPKDVLIHFLKTRFEQFDLDSGIPSEIEVLKMLDVYSNTLLDARALFPKVSAEAVSQLSRTPLLQDAQIGSMTELNLDIYGQWISEDVRKFTPWVRHDQLNAGDVTDSLASWAKQAQKSLLKAIEAHLTEERDAQVILDTRRKITAQYLGLSSKIREESHRETIPRLRTVFIDRFVKVIDLSAEDISLILGKSDSSKAETGSVWDLATDKIDLSKGAMQFRGAILQHRNGRDSCIEENVKRLNNWLQSIDKLWQITQKMRATKWDDDLDLDLDDLANGESLNLILSKQDPDMIEEKLRATTTAAIQRLYREIETTSKSETSDSALLLRSLREIDLRRRILGDKVTIPENESTTLEAIAALHLRIAQHIITGPTKQFTPTLSNPGNPAVALWDGSPPLPVQPTPATFRMLVALQKAMSDCGAELWSPSAVATLTSELDNSLASVFSEHKVPGASPKSDNEGESKEETNPTRSRHSEVRIQRFFDVLYLDAVVSGSKLVKVQQLQKTAQALEKDLDLSQPEIERMRKNAVEYWRRTYLLFGLLAPETSS